MKGQQRSHNGVVVGLSHCEGGVAQVMVKVRRKGVKEGKRSGGRIVKLSMLKWRQKSALSKLLVVSKIECCCYTMQVTRSYPVREPEIIRVKVLICMLRTPETEWG